MFEDNGLNASHAKHPVSSQQFKRRNLSIKIRRLAVRDLDAGFLDSLDNLIPGTSNLKRTRALEILEMVRKNNKLHKIFVATARMEKKEMSHNLIVGTTTLLMEPKFILGGRMVGHIEDVSVRRGYEKMGIGAMLVKHAIDAAQKAGCVKLVLDCSRSTMPFYEKFGFQYQDLCVKKMLEAA